LNIARANRKLEVRKTVSQPITLMVLLLTKAKNIL
jgi:hypothetical protein